jgi:hypothetical protein
MITDRRLLVFFPDQSHQEVALAAITDIAVVDSPGKPIAGGEAVIRIMWVIPDGRTKVVDFATELKAAESFATRLRFAVGAVEQRAFWAERDEIDLDETEAMQEALRLKVESGDWQLPPVLVYRAAGSIPSPVSEAVNCPECGESLRLEEPCASCCVNCSLAWCEPGYEPDVDTDGQMIGVKAHIPLGSSLTPEEERSVICYSLREGIA